MGVLDKLFSRTEVDFSHINEYLYNQHKWLNHLHQKTDELYHKTEQAILTSKDTLTKHNDHKKELDEYFKNISKWITYLEDNDQKLKESMENIEKNLIRSIKNDLAKYHEEQLRYMEDLIEAKIKEQSPKNKPTLPPVPTNIQNNKLTAPEQELLNVMFNQNNPMTYDNIAAKTGKSVNSIRVYMNSLKSKKDYVEEFRKPNGTKIFSIKNKEKIKTLFNLA